MTDLCTIAILAVYSVFALCFYFDLPNAAQLLLFNAAVSIAILAIAAADYLHGGRIFRLFHQFYVVTIIYLIYRQVHYYVPLVNPGLYDDVLIQWDFALFGVHPTHWLAQFAHPLLTEYLQWAYMSFFFLPILHGIELALRKREATLQEFTYTIVFGFYVSYLLYFFMPAIGPRFTLHDFGLLDQELPGVWLTSALREFVNAGGNIPAGTPNPAAVVNRDCMPSGHTMMTLMNIVLAFRYRSYLRYFFLVVGSSLIVATVYLRYHYVVDVLAGIGCALVTLWIAPRLRRWVRQHGFPNA